MQLVCLLGIETAPLFGGTLPLDHTMFLIHVLPVLAKLK